MVVKSLFGLYLIIAGIMKICNQKNNSKTPNNQYIITVQKLHFEKDTHLIRIAFPKELIEEMFSPHNTMDRFTGGVTDGAAWEGLLVGLGLALVALCFSLNINMIIYIKTYGFLKLFPCPLM